MELDETDPAVWPKLEAATQEYILNCAEEFKRACELLAPPLDEDKLLDKPNGHLPSIGLCFFLISLKIFSVSVYSHALFHFVFHCLISLPISMFCSRG